MILVTPFSGSQYCAFAESDWKLVKVLNVNSGRVIARLHRRLSCRGRTGGGPAGWRSLKSTQELRRVDRSRDNLSVCAFAIPEMQTGARRTAPIINRRDIFLSSVLFDNEVD
jgi:hypothetical protein